MKKREETRELKRETGGELRAKCLKAVSSTVVSSRNRFFVDTRVENEAFASLASRLAAPTAFYV